MSSLTEWFNPIKDDEYISLKVNLLPSMPSYEIILYKNGICSMVNDKLCTIMHGFYDIMDNNIIFKINIPSTTEKIDTSTFIIEYYIDNTVPSIHFKQPPFTYIISSIDLHSIMTSIHPKSNHIRNYFGTLHVPNRDWFYATIFHIIVP